MTWAETQGTCNSIWLDDSSNNSVKQTPEQHIRMWCYINQSNINIVIIINHLYNKSRSLYLRELKFYIPECILGISQLDFDLKQSRYLFIGWVADINSKRQQQQLRRTSWFAISQKIHL